MLRPFGAFVGGGADVTPAAVNWGDITITSSYAEMENNAASAQTISAIDATISLKATLSGDGSVGWSKNGAEVSSFSSGSATVNVNSGDVLYVAVTTFSNWPVPPTSGQYVSGTVTVTNESDGAAILDTFAYEARYVYPPP